MNNVEKVKQFILDEFGPIETITKAQVKHVKQKTGLSTSFITSDTNRIKRGVYSLTGPVAQAQKPAVQPKQEIELTTLGETTQEETNISAVDPSYVPFGFFSKLKKVVKSGMFYPVFITGLSGNGKTMMVEQVGAQLQRELIRVPITIETDEDDLLGGFRLSDGDTVWHDGPVVRAMKAGAVLLLDEIDLASNKIMCLQPVLEGNPVFLKKIGKLVTPAPGFTIIATANTKGKGSDDGRFIGTNILNEAFLERFPITVEQEYAPIKTELKIVEKAMEVAGKCDSEFATHLVGWADIIRKTFAEGAVDEIISTRRLVHIVKAFSIFGDRLEAIKLCLNRFDEETKISFLDLYTKIDSGEQKIEGTSEEAGKTEDSEYQTPDTNTSPF